MKLVVRTVAFHFVCILLFATIYYKSTTHFEFVNANTKEKFSFIDYLLLSTTIQAGVGIYSIRPLTAIGKCIMIVQQLMLIMTYVVTLYLF